MHETRLLIYLVDTAEEFTGAEFLCQRGGSHSDGDVEWAGHRRWLVKKVFLNRGTSVCVDRWSVNSFVNYVCSAGEPLTPPIAAAILIHFSH